MQPWLESRGCISDGLRSLLCSAPVWWEPSHHLHEDDMRSTDRRSIHRSLSSKSDKSMPRFDPILYFLKPLRLHFCTFFNNRLKHLVNSSQLMESMGNSVLRPISGRKVTVIEWVKSLTLPPSQPPLKAKTPPSPPPLVVPTSYFPQVSLQ